MKLPQGGGAPVEDTEKFAQEAEAILHFYPRDVVSGVLATATWLAGWLGVRHTPVLYQNG